MESNINHPLAFFESFLTEDNIERELKSFYREAIENERVEHIDHVKREVLVPSQDENGNYALQSILFADTIKRKLENEFHLTKRYLNDASVMFQNSDEEFRNYLKRQENTIRYITINAQSLLSNYPYLITPLKKISQYISHKYPYEENLSYVLKQDFNVETLVTTIFGFMNGTNENRQPIMPENEYHLMIKYIVTFIEDERVPVISQQINKTNISNDLLRFLFYILHKKAFGTRPRRPNFYTFIKTAFKQFDDVTETVLHRKFSNKENLQQRNFLPEIVNLYLKR